MLVLLSLLGAVLWLSYLSFLIRHTQPPFVPGYSLVALESEQCKFLEDFPGSVVLGRPTSNEITFSLFPKSSHSSVKIEAFPENGDPAVHSSIFSLDSKGSSVVLRGLRPNLRYHYTIVRTNNDGHVFCSPMSRFHTERAPGYSFKFVVFGDSHVVEENNFTFSRYEQTMRNIHSEDPDFVVGIGDYFRESILNMHASPDNLRELLKKIPYLSVFAHEASLVTVPGNHEQQIGSPFDRTNDNTAVWSIKNRLAHFPHSLFSSRGTATEETFPNGLENYAAWKWGDALLITLDYINSESQTTGWETTLGYEQFCWLQDVVKQQSVFKFVFHHNVYGASDGIEWTQFYEWGGHSLVNGMNSISEDNSKLTWEFDKMRPGWGNKTIHQVLVENNVDIVFQGHDRLFAKQVNPDGLVFVTVPIPSLSPHNSPQRGNNNSDSDLYIDSLNLYGHVGVDITRNSATVTYVVPKNGEDFAKNAEEQVRNRFVLEK